MDNRAIGVFDSGLGGLTAMKELMCLLPKESIVYFGDTGRVPYGTKSNETIIKYTQGDINFLTSFDLKTIIIACGTASTIALPTVRKTCPVPLLGVATPAVRAAARATKNGRIGIIGTPGTIQSGAYERLLKKQNSDFFTISRPCALFVPMVEAGWTDNEVAYLTAKEYLQPIKDADVDTLIMGCTHYPHLKRTIARVMGDGVALIDPGAETAREAAEHLKEHDMLADGTNREQYRFFSSDCVEDFVQLGSRFLERPIDGQVERIDIEKYTPACGAQENRRLEEVGKGFTAGKEC